MIKGLVRFWVSYNCSNTFSPPSRNDTSWFSLKSPHTELTNLAPLLLRTRTRSLWASFQASSTSHRLTTLFMHVSVYKQLFKSVLLTPSHQPPGQLRCTVTRVFSARHIVAFCFSVLDSTLALGSGFFHTVKSLMTRAGRRNNSDSKLGTTQTSTSTLVCGLRAGERWHNVTSATSAGEGCEQLGFSLLCLCWLMTVKILINTDCGVTNKLPWANLQIHKKPANTEGHLYFT